MEVIPIAGAAVAVGAGISKGLVDGIVSYKLQQIQLEDNKHRKEMEFKEKEFLAKLRLRKEEIEEDKIRFQKHIQQNAEKHRVEIELQKEVGEASRIMEMTKFESDRTERLTNDTYQRQKEEDDKQYTRALQQQQQKWDSDLEKEKMTEDKRRFDRKMEIKEKKQQQLMDLKRDKLKEKTRIKDRQIDFMWQQLRQREKQQQIEEKKIMAEIIDRDLEVLKEIQIQETEEEEKKKIRLMIIQKINQKHSLSTIDF